ncbi:exodeoxyribonuclease V subunit beta [Desulforhopalus sp. IMCC35007]|uniref:exodeoxyribonuclease V subunit beta n=1 Tax=Desulforhopalus sp. IMCC35007 TaxID=2569543 RepID=UPI00145E75C2|nr:exodeoxyribonuclease V subunit beta [Desulforhopalus sp. IMCC35007]
MTEPIVVFDSARAVFSKGISLVEASAGTGKTYAIGMLVLRGIVELGVTIEKILIVTFTKAATEELKSRIRNRLAEARALLVQRLDVSPDRVEEQTDATLVDWLDSLTDYSQAIQRLQIALYDIDNANVFTIHGFCQRMLVDQALESGQLFNVELVTSVEHVISEVVDDFWRNEVYGLDALPCALLTATFETPEKLYASVSEFYKKVGEVQPVEISVETATMAVLEKMEALRVWWQNHSAGLYQFLVEGIASNHFNKGISENFSAWFGAVSLFIDGSSLVFPGELELLTESKLMSGLNGNKFRGEEKKKAYLADWPVPTAEVEEFCRSKNELILAFRLKLAGLKDEVRTRLLQQGTMGFDGLIANLAAGLDGEKGKQLCEVIGGRYSIALIDEFQDTDSLQYKIFSEIFGDGGHYLYLIGDPKQAIYKFRGADIHSYFKARNSARNLLTLEKNYRSHPRLVTEVNRLFASRSKPFLYDENRLGFHRIIPGLTADNYDIVCNEKSLAGMVYCTLPAHPEDKKGRWSSGKAADAFRSYVVGEICRLTGPESTTIYQSGEVHRSLEPKDIAILVRSHRQGQQYLESLIEAGIPAVVSSRTSVFHTTEARELIVLLKAVASPTEIVRLKAAMTISWFDIQGTELVKIWQDEDRLAAWQAKMIFYHGLWLEQGLFAMMNRFIVNENILINIAGSRYAERSIVNLYQLVELIQEQESAENYGIGQVLQWLQRMHLLENGAAGGELLLESDEDAVQIVTMHGAKGLEYPVVFCPYLWYSSSRLEKEQFQIAVHEHGKTVIDLGSEHFSERKALADQEEKAEDLRLLYVALTRAKVRCYTMWGDVKKHTAVADSFGSALGYLLFPEGPCDPQEQYLRFEEIEGQGSSVHHQITAEVPTENFTTKPETAELHPLQASRRSLFTDWQMTSFSGLAALSDYEYEKATTSLIQVEAVVSIAVPNLPAGAHFGNLIHDLLEEFSFSSLSAPSSNPELLSQISRKCEKYGVDATVEEIAKLLECVVSSYLPGGFRLRDLPIDRCLKEMPFYFRFNSFDTAGIYDILQGDPTVLPVSSRQMRGYLTGFVDLVGLFEGKYYIMDYKTNYLGGDLLAYQPDQLVSAMQAHNYGLQYWIYSLVLHRHLQNLLPDYNYRQDFGGVMYLFIRGMSPDAPGSGIYSTLPDYETLQQLNRLFGEEVRCDEAG